MKPLAYSGGSYGNMDEIIKWSESSQSGVRRPRGTRSGERRLKKMVNVRGRRSGKRDVAGRLGEDE